MERWGYLHMQLKHWKVSLILFLELCDRFQWNPRENRSPEQRFQQVPALYEILTEMLYMRFCSWQSRLRGFRRVCVCGEGRKIILANPCFSMSDQQMAWTLMCPRAAAPPLLPAGWRAGTSLCSCIIIIININIYYPLSLLWEYCI